MGMGRNLYKVSGELDNVKVDARLYGSDRFNTLQFVCRKIGL